MIIYDFLALICMAMIAVSAAFDIVERIESRVKSKRRPRNKD